jgi:hypothetical protein
VIVIRLSTVAYIIFDQAAPVYTFALLNSATLFSKHDCLIKTTVRRHDDYRLSTHVNNLVVSGARNLVRKTQAFVAKNPIRKYESALNVECGGALSSLSNFVPSLSSRSIDNEVHKRPPALLR